jgi:hypothetical protein
MQQGTPSSDIVEWGPAAFLPIILEKVSLAFTSSRSHPHLPTSILTTWKRQPPQRPQEPV